MDVFQELHRAQLLSNQPIFPVAIHSIAAENPLMAQIAFSPWTASVKETSVKLLTGPFEQQTRSIMTLSIVNP